ncbi:dockerin type I domain-containing protein [Anatilimnocola floriformis]|uniref:dockerin type I domain-containing protein n=1 Tax=Anatilimnocola floriformis TaxID=2948575 RepID=UPI0020C442E1|nr:dockerin type I domain-containing protein [Anatilimnocola floriformis]
MSTRQSNRRSSSRPTQQTHGRAREQFFSPLKKRRSRTLQFEKLDERRVLTYTATLAGAAAVLTGNGTGDTLIIDQSGGLLRHNRLGDAGFNSAFDFDTTVAGDQTLAASAASSITVNTVGAGADIVQFGTAAAPASTLLAQLINNNNSTGADQLIVDDSTGAANTYSYSTSGVTGTGINVVNNAVSDGGVTLRTGGAGSTVNVLSTFTGEALTLVGSASTTVNIGNGGLTANIAAAVNISNPSAFTSVNINNGSDTTARTIAVSNGSVTGISAGAINFSQNDISNLTVNAGSGADTFNITSTQGLGGTNVNTFNGGGGNDAFNITSTGLAGANNFNGDGGDDAFNFAGVPAVTPVNVDGGLQTTADGDVISILTGTVANTVRHFFTNASSGSIELDGDNVDNGGALEAVINYTGLEPINDNTNAVNRVFTFNGGAETITFGDNATVGDNISRLSSTLAEQVDFLTPTGTMVVNSGAGPDVITLNAPDSLFNTPTITVNASTSADTINVIATRAGTTTTINAGDGLDSVNVGNTGTVGVPGALTPVAGAVVVNGQVGGANLVVDGSGAAVTANYALSATQITRSLPAGFGGVTYSNLNTLLLTVGSGANIVDVTGTPVGVTTTVSTNGGADVVNVTAPALQSILNVNGGDGDDTFNITGVAPPVAVINIDGGLQTTTDGDLINIVAGTVSNTVRHFLDTTSSGRIEFDGDATDNGGAAESTVNYVGLEPINDNANAVNRVFDFGTGNDTDVVISDDATAGNNISRIAAPLNAELVNFLSPTGTLTVNLGVGDDIMAVNAFDSAFPAGVTFNYNGGDGNDEIRVGVTTTTSTTNVFTDIGLTDRTTIGRTAAGTAVSFAQFNQVANGTTLAGIVGTSLNIHDNGLGQVYIDDSGDATARTFNFNANASIPGFAVPGISVTGAPFTGSINYSTFMEIAQFAAGTGSDTLNINATHNNPNTGSDSSTFFGNAGNDTFNINAGALAGESNNMQGDANDDTFNVNLTNANLITAPLFIRGNANDFGGGVGSRDVVTINDLASNTLNVSMTYTGAIGGSEVLVTGLNQTLNVSTSETIDYNGSAANNDTVTVFGTTAGADLISVVPVDPARALVFNGGNPFDSPPEVNATSLPGVAGGSAAPDLDLSGLTTATGLTIQDNGATTGDRLYVYGESEVGLSDGNTFNPFGFGAGLITPTVGAGNAYDVITSSDTQTVVNNYVVVNYDAADFVQAVPNVDSAIVVNAGFEGNPPATVGIDPADQISLTLSSAYKFQVNGGDPDPATTGIVPPDGDALAIAGFFPVINVYSTKNPGGQPVVTMQFPGSGNLGFSYSSIENLGPFSAGTVNLIGDNNDPAVDQNDNFVVVGRDVDSQFGGDVDGTNEFTLQINGSQPIAFAGVQFLNAYGDDQNPAPGTPSVGPNDIDTLEVTPYADDTPRGWGIDVGFNEGNPVGADGAQADLLILHTALFGGQVSENIVIKPSGTDDGEIIVTNASFGTPIVDIDFVANTDIIIRDDDGFLNDTDTVTLLGTNPNTAQVSGNDTFTFNADADMTVAEPLVTVVDSNAPANILYRLREYTTAGNPAGFHDSLTINGLAGNDTINLIGGSEPQQDNQYTFLGGDGDDALNIDMPNGVMFNGTGLFFDGGSGRDSLSIRNSAALNNAVTSSIYTVGAAVGAGQLRYIDGFSSDMVVDFVNLEPVVDTVVSANLIVNATNANNAINYAAGVVATNGLVSVDDHETIEFSNKTTLTLNALAGADTINLNNPNVPTALTTINVNGGDPAIGDTVIVAGTTGTDTVAFTATDFNTASITVATRPTVNMDLVDHIVYDANEQVGFDQLTVNGTIIDDVLTYYAGNGPISFGGTFRSIVSPDFDFLRTGRVTFNGGGGTDTANYIGTEGADVVTSTATAVTLDAPSSLTVLTMDASVELLNLKLLGGDDTVDLDLNLGAQARVIDVGAGNDNVDLSGVLDTGISTIYGGDGNDSILGSPNVDLIYGGSGSDLLRGGGGVDTIYGEDGDDTFGVAGVGAQDAGNDFFYGGDGSDLFIWNPGDGNDLIEGGAGESDRLLFLGSAAANTFVMNQVGTRLEFLFGAVDLDLAGTEEVVVNTLPGADNVTINDLYATDVRHITVDLNPGDADMVTVNGRDVTDAVNINTTAGVTAITGLRYDVRITTAVLADNDVLIFNGNDGNDNIVVNEATSAFFAAPNLRVNGGNGNDFISGHGSLSGDAGDDTLIGGLQAQTLNGGTGNDYLSGGAGVDLLNGDAGEDTFLVNFDGSTDVINGGADYDTVVILGTAANDLIAANQTAAGTLVSSLNGVNDTDTISDVQRVRIEANSGDDIIFVQHLEALSTDATVNSVLFDVDGGAAYTADRLVVQDNGASNVIIYRKSETAGAGSMTIAPTFAEPLYTVFTGIEYADPITSNPNNIYLFKADPYEWNGNFQNATHLGAGNTLNVDPVIDPGIPNVVLPPGFNNPPADEDYYRIEANVTGTLDVQVFFRQNAGLPGSGDLDINLLDAAGNVVANDLDVDDDARIRVPAVEGQIYYLRVFQGTAGALNTYSVTIINEAAPVPFSLELDDDPVNGTPNPPGQTDNSDTGRSQNDNITYDNTPTIIFRVPDNKLINDVPDNSPGQPGLPVDGDIITIPFQADTGNVALLAGFRVAVYRTENNVRVHVGYATSLGNGLYSFTFPAAIPDGSNFISARVEMTDPSLPHNQGFGAFAQDLEIFVDTVAPPVFFGQQSIATDGLHPNSDSGVLGPQPSNIATLSDRITNDTTPTFWGRAEANSIIRAYVDVNGNGAVDPATDIFIGFTTAVPYDGTNQLGNATGNEPNGYWELTSTVNLDSQAVLTALGVPAGQSGGLRRILVSAEDVAGNITSGAAQVQLLNIFIDEQGPQVTGVTITGNPGFDIFDPKSSNVGQSPTPLVNSLSIGVQDFPARLVPPPVGGPATDYPALQETIAEIAAHYEVRGDFVGLVPIQSVNFIPNAAVNGQPATGTIVITFFKPLPDDRFTLTIHDDVVDPAGNRLDGEVNAAEPQENPIFPSGDGVPGGDFVARFTVDTRPELGTWAAGSVWVDTNGNSIFDPDNLDFTNRDIAYLMGYTSDELFAGNFANLGVADGFDKLAAYGKVGNVWRWQIDTDNDGVPNINLVDPAGINGFPVSGNFAPGLAGDEVGLFTGSRWYLDTNGDFNLQTGVTQLGWTFNGVQVTGHGFTGDFDGDGVTDLASWSNDVMYLDVSTLSGGAPNGIIDRAFRFGFPGNRERPIAADFDKDGFTDIGLWTPDRTTQTPGDDAEWYILVSGGTSLLNRIVVDPIPAPGAVTSNIIPFKPTPFGNDLYYQYGDEYSLPVVGNFDPPLTPVTPATLSALQNPRNALDVNNDGRITAFDAIEIINRLNQSSTGALEAPRSSFIRAPFIDVDANGYVTAFDVIPIINYLNLHPTGGAAEAVAGEAWSAGEDAGVDETLLYLLASEQEQLRNKQD